ncbi:hypothetical protein [Bacteroides sp.]|uniref:homing endonuclease associated repeat-containing protein n=1 Tax=Bacteroides sp. TaxID=29523 RepID=UPI0026362473|nr:hypothetical protein [Bacteroides sp.]MDD3040567.1 hypothetical protein [Bacteroides sp.]
MYSRTSMIDSIRNAAVKVHGTPTVRQWEEFSSEGAPSVSTIINFFGSWNVAMLQAGLVPNNNSARWRQLKW